MTYFFHPAAEAEHLETVAYYESKRAGLGASGHIKTPTLLTLATGFAGKMRLTLKQITTTGSASMARDRRHDCYSARARGASPGLPGPS